MKQPLKKVDEQERSPKQGFSRLVKADFFSTDGPKRPLMSLV